MGGVGSLVILVGRRSGQLGTNMASATLLLEDRYVGTINSNFHLGVLILILWTKLAVAIDSVDASGRSSENG